mgnify:CR=1 FL=1
MVGLELKFAWEYIDPIAAGEKTTTIRFPDDERYQRARVGRPIRMTDPDGERFGRATIKNIGFMTARTVVSLELEGFESLAEFHETMADFYPDETFTDSTTWAFVRWHGFIDNGSYFADGDGEFVRGSDVASKTETEQ